MNFINIISVNPFFDVNVTFFIILPFYAFLIFSKITSNTFWFTSFIGKLQHNLLWVILVGEVFGNIFFPSSQYQDILVIIFTGSIMLISMKGELTVLQSLFCSRKFIILCFCFNQHEYHLFVMVILFIVLLVSLSCIFFSEVVVLPDFLEKKNVFDEGSFSVKVVKWLNWEVPLTFLKGFKFSVQVLDRWFFKAFLMSCLFLIFIFIVGIWKYLWIKTGILTVASCFSSILKLIETVSKLDKKLFVIVQCHNMGCCRFTEIRKASTRAIQVTTAAYVGYNRFGKTWDALYTEAAQAVSELSDLSREAVNSTKNAIAAVAKSLSKSSS